MTKIGLRVRRSVTSYGATGNGTTDDTAAIQAAINDTQKTGDGSLYFPPGTYKVTAQLNVTALITLYGDGDSSTIRAGAAMASVLSVTGAARHVFQDLRFDGNGQATNCVSQSVSSETSVGSRWVRCKFTGATGYQMVNNGCEDVSYIDCATDGNEGSPTTVPHALQVVVPNGAVRIIGGEWFGRCSLNMQQVAVYSAVIGPIFIDNPGARTDSLLVLDGCYVYDGGVDSESCVNTGTNLCNLSLRGCYFVPAVQKNIVNGNVPAGVTVRFSDSTVIQTAGLGANPVSYLLQASGAGRLIVDGGQVSLAAGGALHAFNPVSAATTATTTVVPFTGLT